MANGDFQDQLIQLRRRIAGIDRKYANPSPPPPVITRPEPPDQYCPQEWLQGDEIETEHGRHFETERLWERHRRHGSMSIGDLEDLPADLLQPISNGEIEHALPQKWAFLDTETTGLAGGAGTYAFLIGVGRITSEGFRVRQFFMREFGEEASLLHALSEHLSQFDVLITYNGKTYDQPLLETRYRMQRSKPPFGRLAHLDLLFGARRLWKLRFESCRLVELENQILGVEREGDLPGELIPYVYFEYLRTREAFKLLPIFHHNAIDILTLACLTGIVPWAFHSPESANFSHGAEMVGLARWLRKAEQHDTALALFRRAVGHGLRDDLLFRTLWDIAALEKKRGRAEAAIEAFTEIAVSRNPFRAAALEELAKHYEHRERNYAMALEMTRSALEIQNSDAFRHRAARLERRLDRGVAAARAQRLL
jgi:uncharacterized protein YprB with RNaseH-like and TPR domain